MKLSISNIGWEASDDAVVYELMRKYGYSGLEIAPTRIFSENPYDRLDEAKEWSEKIKMNEGFVVPSMQSIWYGRQEKIFGTAEERQVLIDYTKKAICFAEAIGCKNLVFGCPGNRSIPEGKNADLAVDFFRELGDYAKQHNTVIGMEANPPVYNTNFINDTLSAFALTDRVNSQGFKLNLDAGTMIQNNELADELKGRVSRINHVHISEPGLKMIEPRQFHKDLVQILKEENYQGFVSIEMSKRDDIADVEQTLRYVKWLKY